MKIEKVNETQILWSLDKEDLIQNQVNINDFLIGTPKARSLFQEAMKQAERDLMFQSEGHMLYCQIQELNAEKVTFAITKKEELPADPHLICEFESLDDVIAVSGLLLNEMPLENMLYKFEDAYLLLLDPDTEDDTQITWCTVNLSEYADVESISKAQRAYLKEHGECILKEQALQQLQKIS